MDVLLTLQELPLSIYVLGVILIVAVSTAGYALVSGRRRQQILGRVDGRTVVLKAESIFIDDRRSLADRVSRVLRGVVPETLTSRESAGKLVRAGFDGAEAPVIFAAVQVASMVGLPLAASLLIPRTNVSYYFGGISLAIFIGMLLPMAALDRLVLWRQLRLRRSLPDCLDLLVVCVEAGVSLDAALLRVAQEMRAVHPALAEELLVVNRKVNAGVPRERALQGLYDRTGVEEVRALVSSMIQSERWGTSIGTVLRTYSESLRRKRRQHAEKKAGEAAVKMMIPLVFFLLPALFVVIIGPGVLTIMDMFRTMGN
jgi:tight adherence protein C